jgi:hypothetical protein
MSDLESGLKEAIAEAQAKGREFTHRETERHDVPSHIVRSPSQPGKYGRPMPNFNGAEQDKRPPLTAPQVIETILELTKQAREIEALAFELSDALAGGSDSRQVEVSPSNTPDMSIFDRMGLGLLELTRTLESIDRNVKRGLGAVKS